MAPELGATNQTTRLLSSIEAIDLRPARHYAQDRGGSRFETACFRHAFERSMVGADGPWSEALGPDPAGHVMLRRRVDMGGRFACSSQLVLHAGRSAKQHLTDVNLKALLERDYATPTLSAWGTAHGVPIERAEAGVIGIASGTMGLRVDSIGHTVARAAMTFRRMVLLPTTHGLKPNFTTPDPYGSGRKPART